MVGRRLRTAHWTLGGIVAATQTAALAWPPAAPRIWFTALLTALVGATIAYTAAAAGSRGHARRVWLFGAAGMLCWAVATGADLVDEVRTGGAGGRPLAVHVVNLLGLGLAVVAMLAIPAAPRTWSGRLRMALDGAVAGTALFVVAWLLVMSPLRRTLGSAGAAALQLSYPIVAVAVLTVGILLLAGHRVRGKALSYLAGGIVTLTLTLLIEVFGFATGLAWIERGVGSGFLLAALLLALAPAAALPAEPDRAWEPSTAVGRALPYVPVLLAMALCGLETLRGAPLEAPVVWGGVSMVGAVLARQFLALHLNARLTRALEGQHARLVHQAYHDQLTGLPNRAMLTDRLRALQGGSGPADGSTAALIMVDLDGFKAVNDTLGHATGDHLLTAIAGRLRQVTDRLPAGTVLAAGSVATSSRCCSPAAGATWPSRSPSS
jgi:hypothetical protein